MELPKLVFFFDEAHLLFDDAPKALLDSIERVVRLIRSKGVGVYFVTQNPIDVPETILGQLGNRVQHALRAFTPRDQKAVKAAAETFRANPAFDTRDAIQELGTGEALVSFLDEKGTPAMVERAKILFPLSQIGAITPAERDDIIKKSAIYGKYDTAIDRESAFEILLARKRTQDPGGCRAKSSGKKGGKRACSSRKEKIIQGRILEHGDQDSRTHTYHHGPHPRQRACKKRDKPQETPLKTFFYKNSDFSIFMLSFAAY